MDAAILSVGTELITGQSVDTNSAWLSARLTALGIRVAAHVTVGDERERLVEALRRVMDECDLVVVTGGLGPTLDDLTREALSEAVGQPLIENDDALHRIRDFFQKRGRDMPESNRVQAMVPRGGTMIPNDRGTAPGIRCDSGTCAVFALPGVPGEMKPMFVESVEPWVRARTGEATGVTRVLRCHGISEASLGEKLADLMQRGRNPSVGTTASRTIIGVRVVAQGRSLAEAEALAAKDVNEVRSRLGNAVFGENEETMEQVVGRMLIAAGKTIATAESCTGGLLAAALTETPGSSAYFVEGFVTYSNEAKSKLLGIPAELILSHGAVSEETARAMAQRCRIVAGTNYALSITGIAGPSGGTAEKPVGLVYVGLATPGGEVVRKFLWGETLPREEIRDRSCKAALNLLRLELLHSSPAPP